MDNSIFVYFLKLEKAVPRAYNKGQSYSKFKIFNIYKLTKLENNMFYLVNFEKSLKLCEASLFKINFLEHQSLKSLKDIFVLIDKMIRNTFSHFEFLQENFSHFFNLITPTSVGIFL